MSEMEDYNLNDKKLSLSGDLECTNHEIDNIDNIFIKLPNNIFPKINIPYYSSLVETNKILQDDIFKVNKNIADIIKPTLVNIEHLNYQIQPLRQQLLEISKIWSKNIYIPSFQTPVIDPSILTPLHHLKELYTQVLENSIKPILDRSSLDESLFELPPNIQDCMDQLYFSEINDIDNFLKEEGIPLCFIPRGEIVIKLIRAENHAARRNILGNNYKSIVKDCEVLVKNLEQDSLNNEIDFVLDGIGAMRLGYTRSAQAIFTVTLDSIISQFFTVETNRKKITNRPKDGGIPKILKQMSPYEARVWLPVWNAHEHFHKGKENKIPQHYSRHASVHAVSKKQYNKRNCVQSLMLVTSLIGYADKNPEMLSH
jgi:hypothetical protein cresD4_05532